MTGQPLRRRVHEALGEHQAGEALTAFTARAGSPAVGFCYRPTDARWFRLNTDGTALGPAGEPISLAGVFELRVFNATHELRWRNTSAGRGPTVLVSDDDSSVQTGPSLRRAAGYERLLWGTATGPASNGWLSLHNGRIGTLSVPVDGPVPLPGRVWLRAVEYEQEDGYGNVAVVDERLTGLVVRIGITVEAGEEDPR